MQNRESTLSIIQALPNVSPAPQEEVEMPGNVLAITLDYALLPEGLNQQNQDHQDKLKKASFANKLSNGALPVVETIYENIRRKRLGDLSDLHISILSGTDPNELMKQIDQDPTLLLAKLEEKECTGVRGLSGHPASVTLYRTALATEDTQMAEKLRAKLIEVAGEKEAEAQYSAQYPEGWEALEEKRWKPMFKQLEVVTQAIRDAKLGDITSPGNPEYKLTVTEGSNVAIELAQFWSLLDAAPNEVVTIGRHFNPNLLLRAWQTYGDNKLYQKYFGGRWNDPRALLFWQKVIGYDGIQRIMPVNYVQAFHDWLDNTVKKLQNEKPQDRSTRFEIYRSGHWIPVDFYPLQPRCSSDFNFAIYGGRARAVGGIGRSPWGLRDFEAYVNQKTAGLQKTYATAPKQSL